MRFDSHGITPSALGVLWAAFLEAGLTSADVEPTSIPVFRERLKRIRSRRLTGHVLDKFYLCLSYFEERPQFDPNLHECDWSAFMYSSVQWLFGLEWKRGSIVRYEDGSLDMANFLSYFFGYFWSDAGTNVGSPFQQSLATLERWVVDTPQVLEPHAAFDVRASTAELRVAAEQLLESLRFCIVPAVADQYREVGLHCVTWLATCLRFGTCVLSNSPTSWLLETMVSSLPKTCPNLSRLIGTDATAWEDSSLSNLLRRFEFARRAGAASGNSTIQVDYDSALNLELYLKSRSSAVAALVTEFPDDRERIRVVLDNTTSPGGISPILRPTVSDADGAGDAAKSFAVQAGMVKNQSSHIGIRSDVNALRLASHHTKDIIRVALGGRTSSSPNRRSNAVSLTMLFDVSGKYSFIDSTFSWIASHVETGLPILLGEVVCDALGFSDIEAPPPLTDLARLLTTASCAGSSYNFFI